MAEMRPVFSRGGEHDPRSHQRRGHLSTTMRDGSSGGHPRIVQTIGMVGLEYMMNSDGKYRRS